MGAARPRAGWSTRDQLVSGGWPVGKQLTIDSPTLVVDWALCIVVACQLAVEDSPGGKAPGAHRSAGLRGQQALSKLLFTRYSRICIRRNSKLPSRLRKNKPERVRTLILLEGSCQLPPECREPRFLGRPEARNGVSSSSLGS